MPFAQSLRHVRRNRRGEDQHTCQLGAVVQGQVIRCVRMAQKLLEALAEGPGTEHGRLAGRHLCLDAVPCVRRDFRVQKTTVGLDGGGETVGYTHATLGQRPVHLSQGSGFAAYPRHVTGTEVLEPGDEPDVGRIGARPARETGDFPGIRTFGEDAGPA
jgi:hypothetical protein